MPWPPWAKNRNLRRRDRFRLQRGPGVTADADDIWSIHASLARFLGHGVLIRGSSGSGKSDLLLRVIDAGGQLVADDVVQLSMVHDKLWGEAPASGRGLIELRGTGIFKTDYSQGCSIDLVVDLPGGNAEDRLPPARTVQIGEMLLPVVNLDGYAASAIARLRFVLRAERLA